ncbi:MAG TPA: type II toxin-antitoxin system RelE/ParE family toxin [Rhodanobacteraceae bacterium]|nr:type II toxin-antitoxin system RelE/ParE family toxin [Rhodanobacteraceae bacterium]
MREIIQAIDALESNPRIGRPADRHLRELVIGRDSRGYVALYRYIAEVDLVLVLAIRGQREAGYARS